MIRVSVTNGDATKTRADVLILKYAQALYGVDLAVYRELVRSSSEIRMPQVGRCTIAPTHGLIVAPAVLFVGVQKLVNFGYKEIREFGYQALASLSERLDDVYDIAMTIHGPGYGLDEIEAFESQLAGLVDAVSAGASPSDLKTITFVERNESRANRLSIALARLLPGGVLGSHSADSVKNLPKEMLAAFQSAGPKSATKPHIFVAMPFAESMDDIFHYGIQSSVNSAGFLCERADLSTFTGDVMSWVRQRIATASLVIADLSSANPNVYLEVGYAWGRDIPTVLLAKESLDLKFDVRGQRCLLYKSIKHLEGMLREELVGLNR